MKNPIYLIIIVLLIVLAIIVLIIKYFLYPLFFVPKLSQSELLEFLEKKECVFVNKRTLTKAEKKINRFQIKKGFSFGQMFLERAEYLVTGYSESENKYKLFWIELKQYFYFHPKFLYEKLIDKTILNSREINYIEETNQNILIQLQEEFKQNIIFINDKCPACNHEILTNEKECKSCGLKII